MSAVLSFVPFFMLGGLGVKRYATTLKATPTTNWPKRVSVPAVPAAVVAAVVAITKGPFAISGTKS